MSLFPPRAHVTVDDGGVRCVASRGGCYVPFATLVDASVDIGFFGGARLRLVDRGLRALTFRIDPRDALEVQSEVLRGMRALPPPAAAIDESPLVPLARRARPLLDWLASVGAIAIGGYRSAPIDFEGARACLLDAAAPADLRAACAHAMLATAREEELSAVARAFALRALPPLVVVAARLGRAGAALVPDAMCEDALTVLDAADAAAARAAMAAPVTHEDEAHVHDLMERAKTVALREARDLASHPQRKRFHAHALGGYAGSQGVTRFK